MYPETEARCINCRKPLSKHRPWCEKVQTTKPSQQGDIIDHSVFGPTELITVYSRAEAIEDGALVDCTEDPFDELNWNAGLVFDVAITTAAFQRYVEVPEQFRGTQDVKGRYWDIIWMFRCAASRLKTDGDELLFEFLCLPNGDVGFEHNETQPDSGVYRLVKLKAVVGPGDRGEPCLTFMLPSED
jgi:hypothetical protein